VQNKTQNKNRNGKLMANTAELKYVQR